MFEYFSTFSLVVVFILLVFYPLAITLAFYAYREYKGMLADATG